MFSSIKNSGDGFGRLGIILALPFIILVIAYGVYQLFFIPAPVVTGTDAFKLLPAEKTVRLSGENIRAIDISIYQEGKVINLLKDAPETGQKVYSLRINPASIGLADGRAIITIKAEAGILKKAEFNIEALIDTVPPVIRVESAPSVIHQGSGGLSILRASGEESVFIKLVDKDQALEDKEFKAFKVSAAPVSDKKASLKKDIRAGSARQSKGIVSSEYYAFFPAPFDIREGSVFYAVAIDAAGNRSIRALPTRIKMKKYSTSVIDIDDVFMKMVVSPLLNNTDITDVAGAFREVNETWREESMKRLREISIETEPGMLWDGRFLQLKNSKVMATYGDRRTYRYNGKTISKSVHLGYDLASFSYAPVGAANAGIVRFAGNLSIYGNAVIIDHGFGLMSLYGHLSSIAVSRGDKVEKGRIIAQTGSTGLAAGDHLHFAILMHGYEISPLYWWDANWIRINIMDPITR